MVNIKRSVTITVPVFLFLSCLNLYSYAVESFTDNPGRTAWVRTWGTTDSDAVVDSILVPGGSILVTGKLSGEPVDLDPGENSDIHSGKNSFLTRFGSDGEFKMAVTWNAPPSAVAVDSQDNIYIVGNFARSAGFSFDGGNHELKAPDFVDETERDGYLMKLSPKGDFAWVKEWGTEFADSCVEVVIDNSDNIYVAGNYSRDIDLDPGSSSEFHKWHGGSDCFLVKLDSDGNYLWGRDWGGEGFDKIGSLGLTSTGHPVVLFDGQYTSTSENGFARCIETGNLTGAKMFSSNGGESWSESWKAPVYSFISGNDISTGTSGVICLCGEFTGTMEADPGKAEMSLAGSGDFENGFVVMLDESGEYVNWWSFGGNGKTSPTSIESDPEGNIFVGGHFSGEVDFDPGPEAVSRRSNGKWSDGFVCVFDTDGGLRWSTTWGGPGYDYTWSMVVDDSARVYTSGQFYPEKGLESETMEASAGAFVCKFVPDLL